MRGRDSERRANRVPPRTSRSSGDRDQHAQQRRATRGHLLSDRLAQGKAVRAGAPSAVRVLRGAGRASRQVREADRPDAANRTRPPRSPSSRPCGSSGRRTASKSSRSSTRASFAPGNPSSRRRARSGRRSTGIIETEALVRSMRQLCESRGVMIVVGSAVVAGRTRRRPARRPHDGRDHPGGNGRQRAGLYADDVSAIFGGESFTIFPCRGEYAELAPSKRHMVNGLVYPLPHLSGHGLGVHATKTTWGSVLLGPTTRYQARKDDYESDRLPVEDFVRARATVAAGPRGRRSSPGRHGHPGQAAPGDAIVRGLSDPAGRDRSGPRAGLGHRLTRPYVLPGHRRARRKHRQSRLRRR